MILQALLEGGWSQDKDEDSDAETNDKTNATQSDSFAGSNENSLVASILDGKNTAGTENSMVRSALKNQTVRG